MAKSVSLEQLLKTEVIVGTISRIKTPMSRLQRFFGMQVGGPNVNVTGGNSAGWDIFDNVRQLASARAPRTGPANVRPNPVGHQNANFMRLHEKIFLEEDKLHLTRPLGGGWGTIDPRGQRYVGAQEAYLGQRFANSREFMVSRMLRGLFYVRIDGDDWILTDSSSGAAITVDYRVPAGNKTQLDMVGGGDIINVSWATVATADIPNDLMQINAAFEQLHGFPLRHVWCNSVIWNLVLNNAKVQAIGGSSNTVFESFAPTGLVNVEGIDDTGFTARIRAIPWLTWHVYDAGLDVDGTFTKFFGDTVAVFLPDPDPRVFEYMEGSEVIARNVMDPGSEESGFNAWYTRVIDPAGFEIKALDKGLPIVYVPKAIAYGTVVF